MEQGLGSGLEQGLSMIGVDEETNQHAFLGAPGVEAIFGFYSEDLRSVSELKSFKFRPIVHFDDRELDVAVLELNVTGDTEVPCALQEFSKPVKGKAFRLIGHPGSSHMCLDNDKRFVDLSECFEDMQLAREKSLKHVGRDFDCAPYDVLHNQTRVLFHSRFSKGASGSPGVFVNAGGQVAVATMLLCGYPDWLYDPKVEQSKKDSWPKEYAVEQGVNMESVFFKMKERCPDLCREIFPTAAYE